MASSQVVGVGLRAASVVDMVVEHGLGGTSYGTLVLDFIIVAWYI